MVEESAVPPLKPLHADDSLIRSKLAQLEQLPTETLMRTLIPGEKDCLKTRPDGTIIDGHHRIYVLRNRGIDVNGLPREIVRKTDE